MMKVRQLELQIEGIVRVMHSSTGMGVEFMQRTSSQQSRAQEFIQMLVNTTALPNLQVRPDTIDNNASFSSEHISNNDDPLLSLFKTGADLPAHRFPAELHRPRRVEE